jgi:hypothetical protein
MTYNTPPTMKLGETKEIYLLLHPSKSFEDLASELNEKVHDNVHPDRIQISDDMEALLSGSAFGITPLTRERQGVDGKAGAQWKWEIKPNTPGLQRLHLTVNVFPQVRGKEITYAIKTFDKSIMIEVLSTPWHRHFATFIANNWQWLWAAIIVPAAAALFTWMRNRKQKKNKSGGPIPFE